MEDKKVLNKEELEKVTGGIEIPGGIDDLSYELDDIPDEDYIIPLKDGAAHPYY